MAEPVIVPVQLEVTDIDMSNFNPKDVQKQISTALSGVKKSIQDAFSGIDASAINKPIEAAMTAVKKSMQAAEDAQLRYNEALIRAGKSTEEYKSKVKEANSAISNQQSLVNDLSKLGPAAAPVLAEAQKELGALIEARNQINPLDFVDKAAPIELEKVANTYKKVLSAQENVNKQSEQFNQTAEDNKASDEYQELVKKAEAYKKKLTDLNEKSKKMEALGATDTQWENLRKETEWVSSQMDDVIKKMDKAVKTGKAFRFGEGSKKDFRNQINSFAMSNRNSQYTIGRAQKNQSPYTADYQKSLDDLEKLEKKIEAIREKSTKMLELGASKQQFANLAYDAEQLDVKVDEVKNHLMGMVNDGGAFKFGAGDADAEIGKIRDKSARLQSTLTGVATNAKKAQGGLSALGATNPKLAAVLGTVGKVATVMGKVISVAAKIGKVVGTAFGKVAGAIGRVAKGLYSGIKNMNLFGKSGRSTSTDMNSRFKKLTKNILMWGLGFRTAYYAIKRLRTVFVEGFKVMGDQFDEVGQPMMRMIEAFNRLKGSLATAFQPLVSVVMPILTRAMNYLTGMLEAIGKFGATLTGQGYIYKAVAKDINSVAGAAKNANNQLGSYDKLEVIQQDNGTGYDYEKQTIGETESAASNFANMVKEAWENADFTGVGVYVTEQLLGILDNVEKNIIPKVTEFVNRLLKSINTFFDGFGSLAIGDKIGSIVNTLVGGLDWSQVGELLANLYNVMWEFFDGLVNSIDWTLLGQSLSTGLTTLVDNLNFESLANLVTGLTIGLITMFSQIDWAHIANTLLAGFQIVLETLGSALSGSNNPILSGVGDIILAINDAISTLKPAVTSIIKAIGPIVKSILPVISKLLPPIAELLAKAVTMVMPVLVSLFEALMPILSQLFETLLPIAMDLLTSLQPIFDAFTNVILPVIVHLLEVCMPLISSLLNLVTAILAPILSLIGPLLEIVFYILDPVITILEPIISVLTTLCDVISAVLRPILDALLPVLEAVSAVFEILNPIVSILISPLVAIADIFKFIAGVITGVLVIAINVVVKVIESFMNVVKSLANVFTTAFATIRKLFEDLWSWVKKPLNAVLGGIEALANGVIKGINSMVKAMNKLSFDVPDWVPGMGGKKFGFNLKEVSEIKIPRLAQGAVIPPNKEFLAMLGDQKSGTNIEAPLDTIKQAVAEVLAEMGGGSRDPIVLQLEGRTIARVVWDETEKRYKQTGKYAMA